MYTSLRVVDRRKRVIKAISSVCYVPTASVRVIILRYAIQYYIHNIAHMLEENDDIDDDAVESMDRKQSAKKNISIFCFNHFDAKVDVDDDDHQPPHANIILKHVLNFVVP